MAYKLTDWEYSGVTDENDYECRVTEGRKNLLIKDAKFYPDDKKYLLTLKDLDAEDVEFNVSYWLETTDKDTNNIIPNKYTRSTLISLKKALFDNNVGIPAPNDIIGGVVVADVVVKESSNGKRYPRIYKFEAALESIVACASEIEQHSVKE